MLFYFHSFFATVIVKCTPVINYNDKKNLYKLFNHKSQILCFNTFRGHLDFIKTKTTVLKQVLSLVP